MLQQFASAWVRGLWLLSSCLASGRAFAENTCNTTTGLCQSLETLVTSDSSSLDAEGRRTLAAGYRALDLFGHGDLAAGFFTCRSPSNRSVMLVGEQGRHFGEVRASDVVAVDIYTGNVLDEYVGRPVSWGALQVASAVYRRHAHINAFIHSHPKDAMALAALKEPRLMMMTEPSFVFYERVAYEGADFFFGDEYSSKVAAAFDGGKFLLHIRQHAIMVAGKDVPQAFYRAYLFDQAAGLQLRAFASGQELREATREESIWHRRSCEEWAGGFDGSLEWPGILRRLARESPDFAS
mmetsp:Transcript_97427/g.152292  ORF Transcript_97427/g.152292 Transcript_97427/m.152292 type:complete len:295 (+) Transcript_97427:38-922(+)